MGKARQLHSSKEKRFEAKEVYSYYLYHVLELVKTKNFRMLVLDEIIGAYNYDVIVIMTGRNPSLELIELAD